MTPEYNEYGFLVKRKKTPPSEELNEFGFPIKKKGKSKWQRFRGWVRRNSPILITINERFRQGAKKY